MDPSKVPEGQREKLEQLQKSFKEHQQKQQQQEVEHQQQQQQQQNLQFQQPQQVYQQQYDNQVQYQSGYAYQFDYHHHIQSQSQSNYVDGSQSYDQSSQSYYNACYYQQQQQQQQQYGRGQKGLVCNQVYATHHGFEAAQQGYADGRHLCHGTTVVQGQSQVIEPTRVNSQGVSASHVGERSNGLLIGVEKENAGYREQGAAEGWSAGAGYSGLGPAAVDAISLFSQLSRFAGTTFGSVSVPMHSQATQPPYLGDGLTSANFIMGDQTRAFGGHHEIPARLGRGRGRGHGSIRGLGRGRGRGRGRGWSRTRHSQSAEHCTSSSQNTQPSAMGQALQDGFTQEVAPEKGPPQVFKCDLCNVECNRLEILEQHKIGKKHMKNLQKIGPLTKDAHSSAQMMNEQGPASSSIVMTSSQQPIRPQGGQTQSMPEAAGETAKVSKQTDISAAPKHATVGTIEVQNGKKGVKRKLKSGAGGKRLKLDQHIPPVAAPVVCELCNIKCDTQEVFNIHLSGKKHISKAKGYQGHAGPVSLQGAHPPNPILQIHMPPLPQTLLQPQPQPQAQPQPYLNHVYAPQQQPYPHPVTHMVPPDGHPIPVPAVTTVAQVASFSLHHQVFNS
ncbi:hypothetical protein Droror1_Dr00000083 [Drosera rotundifolia]